MPEPERQFAVSQARETFILAGADFVIETLKELPGLIRKIDGLITEGSRPNARQ
jgi:phosphonoacetaldehyde hydrolase